ncbi:group-specific protein [Bacillus sp. YIM B13410]
MNYLKSKGKKTVIEVKIDKEEVRKIYLEELEKHLKKLDNELLFWNTKELERQTNMCMNTMQKEFFFDENFPKRKIGNKWYYPAAQTKKFLLEWINHQSR